MSNPNLYVKKRTTVNEIFNNDPERIELYNKIVESLITAGYFRARINSLEPFDKILGGMAWILTGCFYDIDIEFKDEMNLTEKNKSIRKSGRWFKSNKLPYDIKPSSNTRIRLEAIISNIAMASKKIIRNKR